ncbi:MAG TPA: RNA polymerase factor sigma-54 [Syntrophomonadaceae bacterium]|nr:RNA polymerase factor sigma-54 [Syntrophomonadaceae bacterium]
MRLGHNIQLKQQQKLLMTPELRQAIAILQMSTLELAEHIQQEMEENPLLEEKEPEPEEIKEEKEEEVDTSEIEEWLEYFNDRDIGYTVKDTDESKSFLNYVAQMPNLYEHLELQLRMTVCDRDQLRIGLYLIGNIDNHGYLCIDLSEVAEEFKTNLERVEGVLDIIQSFTPYGVASRSLTECLLLQLKHYGQETELAKIIIEEHLTDLAEKRLNKIASDLGITVQKVQEIGDLLRTLDPKPGLQYNIDEVKYILPDVFVEKLDGEYIVVVNDQQFPRLSVNSSYVKVLRQSDNVTEDVKKYMEEKMGSAMWLLQSIEQRRMTLYKVSSCIVDIQGDFLDRGVRYLKPLNLKQIAELADVHESTVSRATTNKYIQTPQGLFELKYFFSTGLGDCQDDQVSSKSIKYIIEEIIAAEDPTKPLSDEAIRKVLQKKDIQISRRTVAKYRQELGLGSTVDRRRY